MARCLWILRTVYGVRHSCGALAVSGGDYCALHRFGEPRRQRIVKTPAAVNRDVLPWTGSDEAVFEQLTRRRGAKRRRSEGGR